MTRFWSKRAGVLLAIVTIGALSGCGSSADQTKQKIDQANTQAAQIVAAAKAQAAQELQALQPQIAGARAMLKDIRAKIAADSKKLTGLEDQISGAERTVAKSTIPGTGTFVVGSDVKPGTYRAAAQTGCYWARLSSLQTSDIVDNDNADGPVVVQILPSDKAFQAHDCADFHRVGP